MLACGPDVQNKSRWVVSITNQFNFKQSDIDEDGELLNCRQSFQQSNDPGINMLRQRP